MFCLQPLLSSHTALSLVLPCARSVLMESNKKRCREKAFCLAFSSSSVREDYVYTKANVSSQLGILENRELSKAPLQVPAFLNNPQVDPREPVPVLLLMVDVLLLLLQLLLLVLRLRQLLKLLPLELPLMKQQLLML